MLRSLVLILVIVNLCFLAWSQGWLRQWIGVHPDTQREPQRLSQQLQPDRIEVLRPNIRPDEGSRAEAEAAQPAPSAPAATDASASGAGAEAEGTPPAPSAPASTDPSAASSSQVAATASAESTLCVEAGPFRPEDAAVAETSVKALLPAGSWGRQSIPVSGQWMIYMGPYPDEELYARKLAELRRFKGVTFDEVKRPANLAQGLSLGRFTSEKEAEERLSVLKQRGIRSAKLITLRPAGVVQYLRVTQATVRMQVALSGVKLPQGKAFTACRS